MKIQQLLDYLKKNPIYIMVTLAIIFALTVLLYNIARPKPPTSSPVPIPVFSPPSTQQFASPTTSVTTPKQGEQYQSVSDSDQEQIRKDSLVGQLLSKLPYTGTNFSLKYMYSTNQFIATLKTGQEEVGGGQLDAFLQANQIESRSWLKNLIIKSQ